MHSPYHNKTHSWGRSTAGVNRAVPIGEVEPQSARPSQQAEQPKLRLRLN
jgi:hypothetical protein